MAKAKKPSKEPAPVTPVPQTQTVVVLGVAAEEGRADLTPGQYMHMSDLIRQLVFFGSRAYETELRIEKFGDFWELKDKGGRVRQEKHASLFRVQCRNERGSGIKDL